MKSKKSNLICIMLSIIVLFVGMCSEIKRTDSFFVTLQHIAEADTIESVETDILYIGNCTNRLITEPGDAFQKIRRGLGRISLRNYVEFLWWKEILQMLFSLCVVAVVVCQQIQSSETTILKYIHDQDGEK